MRKNITISELPEIFHRSYCTTISFLFKVSLTSSSEVSNSYSLNMSDSDDGLFEQLEAELENDGTFDYYRQKQILQFQHTIKQRENLKQNFELFFNEKNLLERLKSKGSRDGNYLVAFIDETFTTCQILIEKLKETVQLSDGSYSVYIIKASEAPFLVAKLAIKVLPTMVAYVKGQKIGQHVGLQGLLANPIDVNTLSSDRLGRLLISYFPKREDDSSDEE